MLRVVTGRFHPALESALVDRVERIKGADPLAPLAVFVPSRALADRLRTLLAVEAGCSLLNLHILTFHQLALRLADDAPVGHPPLRIAGELFFEQLVRHIARRRLSGLAPLSRIGQSFGTYGALWATIRDLKDADVDPVKAMEGVREGYFGEEDRDWLAALLSLYAAVKESCETLGVGTQNDLAQAVLPLVPASSFLRPLKEVLYYGFYDLTQVQLSFFEAVSRVKDTTLFFPLEDDPAWGFAKRFFDRAIRPLAIAETAMARSERGPAALPDGVRLSIRSVIGAEEELAAACRTILELVETHGYRFDEIGVAARTLDPYSPYLRPVFDRHCIPFYTTASEPLIREPICKLVLQLASLPLNDLYRSSVLDVVTSPLYATDRCSDLSAGYRPGQWKLLVHALHITRGAGEWRRLEQASQAAIVLGGEEGPTESTAIEPEVIDLLWRVVSELIQDCAALPSRGTVGRLAAACRTFAERHLRRPDVAVPDAEAPPDMRRSKAWEALDRVWTALLDLEPLNEEITWAEFYELLAHACEKTANPMQEGPSQGVMVFDVMAGRGVPFKALFLIGLNEHVFPRAIREDAFLRDRHRRVLDATLGFKIDEKLMAYEEEHLLFHLACQSATRRLYLSYQRADESGRPLAASPYVGEARHRYGQDERPAEVVPRRLGERLLRQPQARLFLSPADLLQWLAVSGRDPTDLIRALGRDADMFRHAATALERIEEDGRTLNEFDGMTGAVESHWRVLVDRGMAPTPLERYARCPFQYFAADVLKLEPARVAIGPEVDAALAGTLCHAALRQCYEWLVHRGWPEVQVEDAELVRAIRSSVEEAAAGLHARRPAGYVLLWEMTKELVTALVTAAVAADREEQHEHGFTPIAFEVEGEGTVPNAVGEEVLKIRGRIDRLDRCRTSGALRVIDYKFKTGSSMKPEDRHLVESAIRGYRLQPPFYSGLSLLGHPLPSLVQFVFLAPRWPTPVSRSTFEAPPWPSETGRLISTTIGTLADGIRSGRFFILPDGYCDACGFRVACRREHAPTWWRAHRAVEPNALKALRARKVSNDE